MLRTEDIKLFHRLNVEREIIPTKYELLKYDNNNYSNNNPKYTLKSTGNLSRAQESQFVFSNYEEPNENTQNKKKITLSFDNFINIDKNKLITFLLCNNYEDLFSLFELYIKNIFNVREFEEITNLFQNEIISDSVFVNASYCINIINLNKKSYNHIYLRNNNNRLDTTEIIFKLQEIEKKDIRNHALLLISKFIELLKSLDEIVFIKQIEKLEEILEKNIN